MKIYYSYQTFQSEHHASAVTIGTFDGLHIGHQKILNQLTQYSKQQHLDSVVFTMFPHPRLVLQADQSLKLLNTIAERIALIESCGIDYLVIEPFSKEFSKLSAVEFVRDVLVNCLHTKLLVVGYDHRFGRNREGDFSQLQDFSTLYHFELKQIAKQDIDNIGISSTKIRQALMDGDMETANAYLGYPYLLSGTVIKGQGLGKTLGFPTVNLSIPEAYKLIPKTGVYIVKTEVNKKMVYGIMNIGYRPTVEGNHKTIETFLLNFKGDLYGKNLKIQLLKRLRDEQKFASLDLLKVQINLDELNARKYIDSITKI